MAVITTSPDYILAKTGPGTREKHTAKNVNRHQTDAAMQQMRRHCM